MSLYHCCALKNACELMDFLFTSRLSALDLTSGGYSCAHYAAYCGSLECLKSMLTNCPQLLRARSDKGFNLLHMCQFMERMQCARHLVEIATYDILNEQTENGFTPLHYACYFRSEKMARFLLESGADPNRISKTNQLPLEIAILRQASQTLIKLLRQYTGQSEYSYIARKIENVSHVSFKLETFRLPFDPKTYKYCVEAEEAFNLNMTLDDSQVFILNVKYPGLVC